MSNFDIKSFVSELVESEKAKFSASAIIKRQENAQYVDGFRDAFLTVNKICLETLQAGKGQDGDYLMQTLMDSLEARYNEVKKERDL